MNKKKSIIIGIIILVIIIFLDQITKMILIDKNINIIPGFLRFNYTENIGVAFNIGSNYIVMIMLVDIIILGLIIKFIKENELNLKILLSLFIILAGGISNLVDRLFRGYVVDFIDINLFNFPSFNLADISIVLGIIALVCVILKSIIVEEKKS